jgi:hypothetical protein
MATVRTFQPEDGVWADPENWDPDDDYPKPGDTAIIGQGKTCRAQTADPGATVIMVNGTLSLEGHNLGLGVASPTTSTINGTLCLQDGAEMHIRGTVTLSGSGTISGDDPNDPGVITGPDATDYQIIIDSDLTVTGTISFKQISIENNGLVLVDDSADQIEMGVVGSSEQPADDVEGTGTFKVTAGTMKFGKVKLLSTLTGKCEVSGGTMHFTTYGDDFTTGNPDLVVSGGTLEIDKTFETGGDVDVSGGTLQLDAGLTVSGALDFTGGTIEVASGKKAEFGDVP